MRWLSRRRRKTAVIGTEMVAAVSAENRHSQVVHRPSPLAGLNYELARGQYDLFRFVESPTDDVVSAVALGALGLQGQSLVEYRDAFDQGDLYTLLSFARRVTVRALRGDTDELKAGWAAVGLVDLERVDWRDAAVAVGLLTYGATRAGADPRVLALAGLAIAEPGMRKIMRQYSESGREGLSIGGYREIATHEGPALVEDHGKPYAPTLDLLSIADSVAKVIEGHGYRATGITTGTDVALAWLPSADRGEVDQARNGVLGCVSISAAPTTEATATFPEQMVLAYVAECETPQQAEKLTRASEQPASSEIAAIAENDGRLCLIIVARSTVKGVPAIESTE
ncbi:MAG: hypothetical protein ACRD0W_12125, partial [Acidimicrobiales bacterium]